MKDKQKFRSLSCKLTIKFRYGCGAGKFPFLIILSISNLWTRRGFLWSETLFRIFCVQRVATLNWAEQTTKGQSKWHLLWGNSFISFDLRIIFLEASKPANKRRKRKGSSAAAADISLKKGVSRPNFSLASQVNHQPRYLKYSKCW